jgi:hypothetical protein
MVVVPPGYGAFRACPSLRAPVTVMGPSPSPVAVPGSTVAEHSPSGAVTVWLAGQETVGGVPLTTVIVKLQLPPPCDEVAVTTVEPTGKNEPEAVETLTVPHVPKASAPGYVTIAPDSVPCVVLAITVMLFGHSSTHAVGAPPVFTRKGWADDSLSVAFSSVVLLEMLALLSMVEPADPAVKLSVNSAAAPAGKLAIVQSRLPLLVHVKAFCVPPVCVAESNVALTNSLSMI